MFRGGRWRGVLAGALGTALVFALSLLVVTGIESVKGDPLAGGQPGGLSVLGGGSVGRPDSPRVPDTSRPATGTTSGPGSSEPSSRETSGTAGGTSPSTGTSATTDIRSGDEAAGTRDTADPPGSGSGGTGATDGGLEGTLAPTTGAAEPGVSTSPGAGTTAGTGRESTTGSPTGPSNPASSGGGESSASASSVTDDPTDASVTDPPGAS